MLVKLKPVHGVTTTFYLLLGYNCTQFVKQGKKSAGRDPPNKCVQNESPAVTTKNLKK